MAIYVDSLRDYGADRGDWCHMVTDGSIDELHAFALKIGMKRAWFQDKGSTHHYDLTRPMRYKAVRHGALQISPKKLGEMITVGKVTRR